MDRYYLEHPNAVVPDEDSEDLKLIAQTGTDHERDVLRELKSSVAGLVEIQAGDFEEARAQTLDAFGGKAPIVYQAALSGGRFAGYADFMILEGDAYNVWDTKLARSPKPYYAVQLCCYSEMFAETTAGKMPQKFGVILGSKNRVEFRVEDFIHYYRRVRDSFLVTQDGFTGELKDCPEPQPNADHGRWTSHAERYFEDADHLVRVAGITVGQIKKLRAAGVITMTQLGNASGKTVKRLAKDTLEKLSAQARLQMQTNAGRQKDPKAKAAYQLIPQGNQYEPTGLAALPPPHDADVFFDMEGYPLIAGGLEYLFGAVCSNNKGSLEFKDWWAHDRAEEKKAFEEFVDWAFARWRANLGMHIYYYAAYEVSAIRRLSIQHNTRQDEVDDLLKREVFVDLYQVVSHGLRIGEDSYSLKSVELLYREARSTDVATAADSMVQYARWMGSGQPRDWRKSEILKAIRDYNEDDCCSTYELAAWLRQVATANGIPPCTTGKAAASAKPYAEKELAPEIIKRLEIAEALAKRGDPVSIALSELVDFHRREQKPMWWRMFDRAKATPEELRDDSGCIEGVKAVGAPTIEKQSLLQRFTFDPSQECKLRSGDRERVMFTHDLETKPNLVELDVAGGTLTLKLGKKSVADKYGGKFPSYGSLIPYESVPVDVIQAALAEVAEKHLSGVLPTTAMALLTRLAPAAVLQGGSETTTAAAVRVTGSMNGGCLVIQGPPGTGKTYTAADVITVLLAAGKKVGVASNSHKAVFNLLKACGEAARESGRPLRGIKVGGDPNDPVFSDNPGLQYIKENRDGASAYSDGILGGTAWLFSQPALEGRLDFLFLDEAGQVSLANSIAMARSAQNIVLLGDQMQLEQPVQGSHPGDSRLSGLQFALKDLQASKPDAPVFHAVVPSDYGLFLAESWRMHPTVCTFISESMYEGRLSSVDQCARQRIDVIPDAERFVSKEHGIVFVGVEHDGNIQQSEEEIDRVKTILGELLGRPYTASDGTTKALALDDFLFIAPYNAQVRALQAALPAGACVGSVDKFQGQQAAVCILSLCSSYGEYGTRGLAFILDRNRLNVAISRAQCLAVVVADPRIASSPVASLNEMMLVNLFCKIVGQGDTNLAL